LVPSPDGSDNAIRVGGPGEGLGVGIGFGDETVDGGLQVDDAVPDALNDAHEFVPRQPAL
jgi:hypothetical protein